MIILTPKKAKVIPECNKCGSKMLPLDMEKLDVWKCPYCMNVYTERVFSHDHILNKKSL